MEGLKRNIPTHELDLGGNIVVVFYDFITTGESRELQKMLLEKGKFNTATNQVEDLPLGVFLDSQDKAASFVIKEVKISEVSQAFTAEWLAALPVEQGNKVYDEVNKLTQVSQLTPEEKKIS